MKMNRTVHAAERRVLKLVPTPWNVEEFARRVAETRNKPVRIVDLDFSPQGGITGAWKPTSKQDIIFVSSSAAGLRRDAIICHELAHMTLGHTPSELGFTGSAAVQDIAPLLLEASPALASKFMFRHDYDSQAESDAEHLATVVIAAISAVPANRTAHHVAKSLL